MTAESQAPEGGPACPHTGQCHPGFCPCSDARNATTPPGASQAAEPGGSQARVVAPAPGFSSGVSAQAPGLAPSPAEAHGAADTVQLVGVKDGVETVIGTATMPPKMKARELVREMFGAWEPEDGSDADMAFAICEQLIEWMPKNPPSFNVESQAQPKGTHDDLQRRLRDPSISGAAAKVLVLEAADALAAQSPAPAHKADELAAFEEWRNTLHAADLDGKFDLVWRHIAGEGFQAGAAWARTQAPAVQDGAAQRLLRECELFLRVIGLDSEPAAKLAADWRGLLAEKVKAEELADIAALRERREANVPVQGSQP